MEGLPIEFECEVAGDLVVPKNPPSPFFTGGVVELLDPLGPALPSTAGLRPNIPPIPPPENMAGRVPSERPRPCSCDEPRHPTQLNDIYVNLTTFSRRIFGTAFFSPPFTSKGAPPAMWSVGNKSSFIPATTDAKEGLAKGLERATAAIAKAPVHEWKRRDEKEEPKSHWVIAGDAPRESKVIGSGTLDKHLELELAMAASRKKLEGAGGDESDSSAYDSDSSSSSSSRKKSKKKGKKKSKDNSKKRKRDKGSKASRKKDKKKDSKKRRRKESKRGSSSNESDSDVSDKQSKCVSFVSGEKLKMKLEGVNKRDDNEDERRRQYLHQLNATVDLKVMERGD